MELELKNRKENKRNMPQLDKLSYSTQIFWLLILFTSFYFIILKNILPSILLNIKTREDILNSMVSESSSSALEIKTAGSDYVKINSNITQTLGNYLSEVFNLINKAYSYTSIVINYSNTDKVIPQIVKPIIK